MKSNSIFKLFLAAAVVAACAYPAPAPVRSQSKTELQQELEAVESLIREYEQELSQARSQRQTLAGQLSQLKKEQAKIQLQIRSTSLRLDELQDAILQAGEGIKNSVEEIEQLKGKSAGLLKIVHQNDQASAVEVLLMSESLPAAINSMAAAERLTEEVLERSKEIKSLKEELERRREEMELQEEEAKTLLNLQALQESEFRVRVDEQNQLVAQTAGVEERYQAMLAESKGRAAQIRMRLYELAGGTTTQVTFAQAVEIAKNASSYTGVRPAFLLAVLTQESNLGKNVGTCNRAGDPPEKGYRNIMHPTRDIPVFLEVTNELGLDPETTPVSCPMFRNGQRFGWGGAMGPAQFIPSTWRAYKGKVAAVTGKSANPWDIHDAFLAAGLLLRDNGAAQNGRQGEWEAALRYFSGSVNPAYRFYADSVLGLADRYQAELDAISQS